MIPPSPPLRKAISHSLDLSSTSSIIISPSWWRLIWVEANDYGFMVAPSSPCTKWSLAPSSASLITPSHEKNKGSGGFLTQAVTVPILTTFPEIESFLLTFSRTLLRHPCTPPTQPFVRLFNRACPGKTWRDSSLRRDGITSREMGCHNHHNFFHSLWG